jgi:shikimate dehydrogenase
MKVFTLDELASINEGGFKPARFAVIGHPVGHSLSPELHQPALDALGQDARYVRIEVPPGQVAESFQKLRAAGFLGINVTVPHKLEALEACDEVDPSARAMGAVNTVIFEPNGRHSGFNTDGPGLARAIREEFSVDLGDLKVIIIGAGGGAGRAIATQCVIENCPQVILVNRTLEKLTGIRDQLTKMIHREDLEGPRDWLEIMALDDPGLGEALEASELVINTTSIGLKATDPAPFPTRLIEPHHLVYDTIYNPTRTKLLREAEVQGARTANGLSLLVHQGALSLEYWLNCEPPVAAMRAGVEAAIKG